MKSDQHQVKKAVDQLANQVDHTAAENYEKFASNLMQKGVTPKDILGLSDQMVEGIYGQAYRLYQTGRYKDASQLFRLLIMIKATESKFCLGLAACLHMMKDFQAAAEVYSICGVVDPHNPIPHFHASDCYIQLGDKLSAIVSLETAVKRAGEKQEYKTLKDRALLTIESLKKDLKESAK